MLHLTTSYRVTEKRVGFFSTPIYVLFSILAIMFLPFTKALTLDIGYPLKIYEVAFSIALLFFVLQLSAFRGSLFLQILSYAVIFWFVALCSSLIGIIEVTPVSNLNFRSGRASDAIMRVVYLAFNIGVFALAFHICLKYPSMIVRAWFIGLFLAFSYHFYTFVSVVLTGDAILLPGLERHQIGRIGELMVPRSGIFEEGNFAGLYYLASFALALQMQQWRFVIVSILGLMLTLSTSAYAALLFLVLVYGYFKWGMTVKQVFVLVAIIMFGAIAYSKLDIDSKFNGNAGASGAVRLNEAITGIEIFKENPVFGVGLGGYGFMFDQFEWDPDLSLYVQSERRIPNNVYVELLSETGIVGLVSFFLFYWSWLRVMMRAPSRAKALFAFGKAVFIAFVAYPTFNITYLWCFFGIAAGLVYSKSGCLK